ncbi:MAG: hypothetical protein AB7U38_03760 [Hyphomicrobiales bacterium]
MAQQSEPAITNGRRAGAKSIVEKRKSGRKRLALKVPAETPAGEEDFGGDSITFRAADPDSDNVILVGPLGDASMANTAANDDEAAYAGGQPDAAPGDEMAAMAESGADEPDGEAAQPAGDTPVASVAPGLSDPELIAILQQLSTTIDTAHQVLDEANALEASRTGTMQPEALEDGTVQPVEEPRETAPQAMTAAHYHRHHDEDSYAGIDREMPPLPPAYMKAPKSSARGIGIAAIAACVATVGAVAWVFHANPWLTEDRTAATGEVRREAALSAPPATAAGKPPAPAVQAESATGAPGMPIPLRIDLPPAEQGTEISLMIQGVPEDGQLSAGRNIGGGVWIVDFADAPDLSLTVPKGFGAQQVDIEVTFVKSDGKVPEARLIDVVIDPARAPRLPDGVTHAAGQAGTAPLVAAPPLKAQREPAPGGASPMPAALAAATPAARPEPAPEPSAVMPQPPAQAQPKQATAPAAPNLAALPKDIEERMLARGTEMMKAGDVAGARLIYEHAARRGSRAAMTELGKSFDPEHLTKLGVLGVKPDKDQAKAWYERASRMADR